LNVAVRTRTVFRNESAAAAENVEAAVAVEKLPPAAIQEIGKFDWKHGRKNCSVWNILD